jgi:hypothetical protein
VSSESGSRRLAWAAILLIAFVLRAAPLGPARPYIAYVDEGNFLHPVVKLLREGGWDPRWYLYPQFPTIAVTGALRLWSPVYRALHGHGLQEDLSPSPQIYDELEPFEVLLVARLLGLVLGLAVVGLTGLFASRLAGRAAGLFAALLAALAPSLVLRGSIASVDSYATFFVLVCLILTDATRTSRRPGPVSFAAGAMAGAAFASKYPSVVVLAAFEVTTLLETMGWREKLRRAALAGLGLVVGATLAMPALVLHPAEVYGAIRSQASVYGQMASPHLWEQAVLRAEWDLSYERAEMGFVFLALAAAGFLLGLRDRRLAPTFWGWLVFVALSLAMYSRQAFQPFRNLLPLVPLACIAAALLLARVRQRLRHPAWADAAAVVWALAAFGIPLAGYARERMQLTDSRKEAVDWLVANAPGEPALVVRELGFLNQELERLRSRPDVRWWTAAEPALQQRRPRYLVAGVIRREGAVPVDVAASPAVAADYALRVRFGEKPTVPFTSWWRGNRQIVYVFERRTRASMDRPRDSP